MKCFSILAVRIVIRIINRYGIISNLFLNQLILFVYVNMSGCNESFLPPQISFTQTVRVDIFNYIFSNDFLLLKEGDFL